MFDIPAQRFNQLRKNALAKALMESFQNGSQQASIDPITGDVLATDPRGHSLRFGFDAHGFVGKITSPLGRSWQLDNGPQGRLQAITNPAGLKTHLNYDDKGRLSEVSTNEQKQLGLDYDTVGNLARIHYADGSATVLHYHAPGQLIDKTDRLGHEEHYRYDDDGKLIAITNANGYSTEFEYGDWDTPDKAHYPEGREENYAYDANGRVQRIAVKDGPAVSLYYAGDAVQPERIVYDDEVIEFIRDDQGRILQAKNLEATAQYQYDDQGRVIREEVNGAVVQYRYDETGNLVGLTYPSGETVHFGYDADLRLDSVEDWNGGLYRWGYDQQDRAHALSYPNGLEAHVWQTPTGRIKAIDMQSQMAQRIFGSRYRYDAEDRLAESQDTDFGVHRYDYDAESRLLAVDTDTPEQSERFAYDANGNRIEYNGKTAEFDAGDRLLRQGQTYCSYDKQGNLAELQSRTAVWRYAWNSHGQLIQAESYDGRIIRFGYDAFGRRLWKRNEQDGNLIETRFQWAGEHLIGEETWENGQRIRCQSYLYLPGTYTPLATRIDNKVFYYHSDPLGTPRRLTDSKGQIVWQADYDAFGTAKLSVEDITNPLRFPGQYFDKETGLHYNRFRYYSPELGRYLSCDPLCYLEGLNLYSYCGNNPINQMDPLGLFSLTGFIKAAIPIVAAIAVGVAVVALAPIALPLAIIAGGIAAGAVYGGLNEAINGTFSFECIAKAALKGGIVGGLASIPFLFLPATAGLAAFAGVGAASGAISYTGDWVANGANPNDWSWKGFGVAVGLGAVTAGAGRYLGGKIASARYSKERPYSHLEDPPNVALGKDFAAKQKEAIYAENVKRNEGVLKDDISNRGKFRQGADNQLEGLSIDPQTGKSNPKSKLEAESILQAEQDGLFANPRRPDLQNSEPNIDFNTDKGWVDVKRAVAPSLRTVQKQVVDVSNSIKSQDADFFLVDLKELDVVDKGIYKIGLCDLLGDKINKVRFIND